MDDDESPRAGAADQSAPALSGLTDTSPVLVLAEAGIDAEGTVCRSLLSPEPHETQQVVTLSLTEGVDGCLERLGETEGLKRIHVITSRQGASATAVTTSGSTNLVTERVPDPSDLPRLGMAVSKAVTAADIGRVRVCIDSLTALLQYVDRGRVYRFVQVLQDRLNTSNTVAHYHLNPAAHDQQTVETLRQLFEAVVELSPEGDVERVE
jgi:hypothetical protein